MMIVICAVAVLLGYVAFSRVSLSPMRLAYANRPGGAVFAVGAGSKGAAIGQSNYQAQCASCHGNGGKGDGWTAWLFRLKMRDFTDSAYMQSLPDEYLVQIIKQGGASLGKPGMPSWGKELTDQEIDDLVAYIRSFALPVQPSESTGASR